MVVGEVATGTDVLVIGGGPGGYTAALRSAAMGTSVTLVERDRLGGVCLNVGCIPSKALIEAAHRTGLAAQDATGVRLEATVDMPAVQKWMAATVATLTAGVDGLLRRAGVTVVPGTARFAKPGRVAVQHGDDTTWFEPGATIVATGSRPAELPGLPFDGVRVLDSTDALAVDHVPDRLVVVGGGYIGVELGSAFAHLGAAVTIVEQADQLLPGMPAGLARVLELSLRARDVDVHLGATVQALDGTDLVVDGDPGRIPAPLVVVAVGRRPNTSGIGLEAVGVRLDPAGLVVVDPSRRAARNVYAIGDITPGPALAHKATAEAEVAAMAAAGRPAAFDPTVIPAVVFSDPEIATVGLTREQAGGGATVLRLPLTASGRALIHGATDGYVEIVADAEGTLVGAHMAGPTVSELAFAAALAIEIGATVEDLALTIAPHPTISEALADAARTSRRS